LLDLSQGMDDSAERGGKKKFAFHSTPRTGNGAVMTKLVVLIHSLLFPLQAQTAEAVKW